MVFETSLRRSLWYLNRILKRWLGSDRLRQDPATLEFVQDPLGRCIEVSRTGEDNVGVRGSRFRRNNFPLG